MLTDLERHASYSAHRLHRLIKLLVFRVCNTQSLFLVRYFADVPFYPCMAARAGNQAFVMVLLDLTVSNIAEIGFSAAFNAAHRWQQRRAASKGPGKVSSAHTGGVAEPSFPAAKKATAPARTAPLGAVQTRQGGGSEAKEEQGGRESNGGGGYDKSEAEGDRDDGSSKGEVEEEGDAVAEIELTDDYLELLYRQYVMLACLGAFPLVTVRWPSSRLPDFKVPCAAWGCGRPQTNGLRQHIRALHTQLLPTAPTRMQMRVTTRLPGRESESVRLRSSPEAWQSPGLSGLSCMIQDAAETNANFDHVPA